MANYINMVSKNSEGKVVNKNIPNINPEASDADIKTFVKTLGALSDNTLVAAQKIVATDIDRTATEPDEPPEPPVTIKGTNDADNIYSDKYGAIIYPLNGEDSISLDGAVKNEVHLVNNNKQYVYIYNDAHDNSICGSTGSNHIYSSVTGGNVFISTGNSDSIYGYSDNDSLFITKERFTIIGAYKNYQYQVTNQIILPSVPAYTRLQIFDADGNRVSIGTEKDGEYFTNPIIVDNSTAATSFSSKPYSDITNSGDNVSISGNYDATISNSGDYAYIRGTHNDIITNSGDNVSIRSSSASLNSSIFTSGDNVSIDCRNDASITLAGSHQLVSIYSGAPSVSGFKNGDSIAFQYRFTESICGDSDITLISRGANNTISPVRGYVVLQGIYREDGTRPEIVIMDSLGAHTIQETFTDAGNYEVILP